MVRRRGQDDLTRQRRLNDGCCPTHGVALVQVGIAYSKDGEPEGDLVVCPRGDCTFKREVRPGTKLWDALRDCEEKMFTGGKNAKK